MQRALRIGIAGLGRLGQRHAEIFRWRLRGAEVVAAASPSADERAWASKTLDITDVVSDYAQLLALPDIDAVVIVTPTSMHADQVIAALDAGKHVFCEKPLALDVADCLRVEAAAARHTAQRVLVGFVRRFDPSYTAALQKIHAGAIGTPFMVRSQTLDKNDPSGFFVRFAPTSGGIFLDMSIHDSRDGEDLYRVLREGTGWELVESLEGHFRFLSLKIARAVSSSMSARMLVSAWLPGSSSNSSLSVCR